MRSGTPTDRPTAEHLLGEVRSRVDPLLETYLTERRTELAAIDPEGGALVDELLRLLRAGGKRLRPALCLLGHRAVGGPEGEQILTAAAALELFHTFALIHDDVMDDGAERRGVPSVHVSLAALHGSRGLTGDPERFGRSAAVLAGDLAAVLADELLRGSGFPPEVLAVALRRYDRFRIEMAVGQYLDLLGPLPTGPDEARARRVAALKTGSYSVEGPLEVGAALAEASIEQMSALSRFGAPLGEAFQVRDDVLGALSGEGGALGGDEPAVVLAVARRLAGEGEVSAARTMDQAVAEAARAVNRLVDRAVSELDPAVLDPEATASLAVLARALVLPWP